MLQAFEKARKLDRELNKIKNQGNIIDYRLILKLNMSLNLFIVADTAIEDEINKVIKQEKISVNLEIISEAEYADDYYQSLFENKKQLDIGLRRSLSNILDHDNNKCDMDSCPIVSFYSYKGGVGRTTALALFATFYSINYGKKVFIIDCDFEAPGLINFFGLCNDEILKNGIIEYIKDKEALPDISLSKEYLYEVSREYTKNGEIYILPAGNIMEHLDRIDYIEALARLDIHNTDTVVDQFKDVIEDINRSFKPDVILIDTRTGLNDTFGIISNRLSDIIVGFFRNNTQTRPGLHFFLDTFLSKKRNIGLILVNSILSISIKKNVKLFQEEVDTYIQDNLEENFLDSLPAIPVFSLQRYQTLEDIGTLNEDMEDFVTAAIELNDYKALFEKISQLVNDSRKIELIEEDLGDDSIDPSELRKEILTKLYDNYPDLYPENMEFSDSFLNTQFYFRICMEDIFNHDKFIFLGSKGTGKTSFYKALMDENFFVKLAQKANKDASDYHLINMVSLPNKPSEKMGKFIDIEAQFEQSEIKDKEFFYRRFWIVYIWNVLMLDSQYIKQNTVLETKEILDDSHTADYFKRVIYHDQLFQKIENELHEFDKKISSKNKNFLIIFDQLDKLVQPNLWNDVISPLIKYCHTSRLKGIWPKLFVRNDLFDKLGHLTNKKSLKQQSINMEWKKEELYAFFFKVVFAYCKKPFFSYLNKSKSTNNNLLETIRENFNRNDIYNQIDTDKRTLKPLFETFFGKYADPEGTSRYGEMYEWIFKNLKNADNTISLRPFLDLIKHAIEEKKNAHYDNAAPYPALPANCFTRNVRIQAVKNYFEDIASEPGNETLSTIMNDIKDNKIPKEFKMFSLSQYKFEKLLETILNNHPELEGTSLSEMEETLIRNGIIFVSYPRGKKMYSFAYLYKYFLGLRTPRYRNSY